MALLLILGLALLGLLVLLVQVRAARRDRRSVEAHHHVLSRLQHAADSRSQPGGLAPHVRVVSSDGPTGRLAVPPGRSSGPPVAAAPPVPPAAAATSAPAPAVSEPPPAEAASPITSAPASGPTVPPGRVPVTTHAGVPVLPIRPISPPRRGRGRAGRLVGALAVAAILGVGSWAAVSGFGKSGPHARPQTSPAQPSRPAATTRPTRSPAPPTTRAGAGSSATATSTSPTGATYVVTSTPVRLTLAATGTCWVELRSGSASGPILFEGDLGPGASHAFTNQSGIWLRVGYPAGVSLMLDGSPVKLPATGSPYDVSVQFA